MNGPARRSAPFLAAALAALLSAPGASPCTLALISGKAARNGRTLMWKNRDTTEVLNSLMHIQGPKYAFTALVNAGDVNGDEVWGGLNTAGFAIMNSQADDLADAARRHDGAGNGALMRMALGECATAGDFEALLIREKGRFDLAANFGVIDAEGNACFFETSHSSFRKFDARDPRVAPFGTIIRTNFAFTSPDPLRGGGFVRFERASHIVEAGRGANRLDVRFILQEAARDLVHEKLHSYPLAGPLPADPAEPMHINTNDTINRNSSVSTVVFEAAPSRDKAHLATMWVILGQPVTCAAVPVWPWTGRVPAVTAGPGTPPLNAFSRALAAHLYPDRRGRMPQYLNVSRLRTYGGEGVLAKLIRVENAVLESAAEALARWERVRPTAKEAADFQESAASGVLESLKREFPDIR